MHEPASVTGRLITADFLTPGYRIVGQIMVPRSGLMGLMNDVTSNFVEAQDAKLARLHMPTKLVGEYKLINLVKPNIFAVCLARREDAGPQAVARGGYQNLIKYPIRVTTQVYELEGTLEWSGRFDFSTVMMEGTRDFIPLYETTLTAILIPSLRIESPAVLFNRKQVDLLALLSDRKEI
ncbi:MAG: hypothetical protein QMD04_11805 [Anaerolineales bacterium]|nr:hypothetical protein [Anaerolineales bacterium]